MLRLWRNDMAKRPSRNPAKETPQVGSSAAPERRRRPRGRVVDQADGFVGLAPTPAAGENTNDEHADDRPASVMESVSMASEPSEEDVRLRAYQRYIERGRRDGSDFDDWLTAEAELRKHR
jgi:hypothetical protein